MQQRGSARFRVHRPDGLRGAVPRAQVSKKTVQIVALIGVVGALAAVVYVTTRGNRTDQYYDEMHLQCTACKHEFTMAPAEVGRVRGTAGDPRKRLTCPKCGKEAGEEMTPCEKCSKWFLPKALGAGLSLRCPHCGYDPDTPSGH
jgi:DNA-directed RNA polymerase subunit RPC12/RpoP